MICEECKAVGQTSHVYLGGGTSTAMYCPPFWDETGVFHVHDSNRHTTEYSCSRGHRWVVTAENRCPAGDWALVVGRNP